MNNPPKSLKNKTVNARLKLAVECLCRDLSQEQQNRLAYAMMFQGSGHNAIMKIVNGGDK